MITQLRSFAFTTQEAISFPQIFYCHFQYQSLTFIGLSHPDIAISGISVYQAAAKFRSTTISRFTGCNSCISVCSEPLSNDDLYIKYNYIQNSHTNVLENTSLKHFSIFLTLLFAVSLHNNVKHGCQTPLVPWAKPRPHDSLQARSGPTFCGGFSSIM